jgi:hypothetical protein
MTLWCFCLIRAMVCSQRTASLSQSPRVGFLSSLLPQSKKSPSRLSPAQGPSQAQSSVKKEAFSGQVSIGCAFLTLAKKPLTSDSQVYVWTSLSSIDMCVLLGLHSWMCYMIPNLFLVPFISPSPLFSSQTRDSSSG